MRCPRCGHPDSMVLNSRHSEDGAVIRRRRQCTACGERFTTRERAEEGPFVVVKKDGRREVFDRGKILRGLLVACEKRPVPLAQLEQLVVEVEAELRRRYEGEVPSEEIGEAVMTRLQGLDQVAYVRFASVYRQFQDIQRFKEELDRLLVMPRAAGGGPTSGGSSGS